jgi:hypothetical protein
MGHTPDDKGGLIDLARPWPQPILVDHVDVSVRLGKEHCQQVARFAPGHDVREDFAQFFDGAVPHDKLGEGIRWDTEHAGPILEAHRVDRGDRSVFEDHFIRLTIYVDPYRLRQPSEGAGRNAALEQRGHRSQETHYVRNVNLPGIIAIELRTPRLGCLGEYSAGG